MGVSQNCGPHKRAERYSPIQCVYVVFHTFLGVTSSAPGFWESSKYLSLVKDSSLAAKNSIISCSRTIKIRSPDTGDAGHGFVFLSKYVWRRWRRLRDVGYNRNQRNVTATTYSSLPLMYMFVYRRDGSRSPVSSSCSSCSQWIPTWVFLKTVCLTKEQNVTDLHRLF